MNALLCWVIDTLNASSVNHFVMGNAVVFPTLEMAHFMGLCLLFGSLLMVDLRLIGLTTQIPLDKIDALLRVAIIGFSINLISGLLFVIGDPERYLSNVAFWAKVLTIACAGLNTLYYVLRIKPQMTRRLPHEGLATHGCIVAWLSLVLWIAVIILGRFIPYLETP